MAAREGKGGFKARCSGQRGGLTGARVTGPHIGELSVPICLQAEKRGEMQGRQRERDETRRRDRTVKEGEIERRRKRERTKVARTVGERDGNKGRGRVHSNQNVNYLTSR